MTEITATLTGTVEWEYDESGSKCHDIVIKLSNGRRFPTGIRVYMHLDKECKVDGFSVSKGRFAQRYNTEKEAKVKIEELLAEDGWTLKVEDKGSYNI